MFKKFTPRTLFGRSMLIVVTPVVILQIIIAIVFFNNHWDNITRRLSLAIGGDIATIINLLEKKENSENEIQEIAKRFMDLKFTLIPNEIIKKTVIRKKPLLNIPDKMLEKALGEKIFKPYSIDTVNYGNQVKIEVQLSYGVLKFLSNRKRVDSTSAIIFVLWMVGTSVILIFVAIIFLKNQLRPIKELSSVADKLGKGHQVNDIKPSGAIEIRQAMIAFMAMRDRIKKTVEKRTEMLAGVSHDLRTPLTRMKLDLALIGKNTDVSNLENDVRNMEEMINSYINFAKEQNLDKRVSSDINKIVEQIINEININEYNIENELSFSKNYFVDPNSLKRCVSNLILNSLKYAPNNGNKERVIIRIGSFESDKKINITIEDNGPGIPEQKYNEAFAPFNRLEETTNLVGAGVGLGLTISKDIARSHGGDLELAKSDLGGLKATIIIPI
ncbi:MAG: Osmolarity sensor protein EnvZ [Alphaproteobacteria bacterium MarineAlpha2_Bin1]|nr:MAG: Osmolarity sensor protein EnvZ [Alphaproteobacteria bacterium MarineAlpha2_Bin1]